MAAEVSLEFMTGNPQLGVLSGRLKYIDTKRLDNSKKDVQTEGKRDHDEELDIEDSKDTEIPKAVPVSSEDLPEHRRPLLCIMSAPAHMIPTDMLQFVAPFKRHVHFVRILRPCNPVGRSDPARTPAEYMVLLQMENQEHADDLFLQCNGKRFNSFEEARCRVVFVATVSFDLRATAALPTPGSPSITGAGGGSCGNNGGVATVTAPDFTPSPRAADATIAISADKNRGPSEVSMSSMHTDVRFAPFMPPAYTGGGNMVSAGIVGSSNSATATEAHDASTCVICMDRMESHVLMTVCNHSFHVECLVKWQDSPCPVCRFHHNNASEASTCQECQASDNLWVCLICGSVLCGSRHGDHVRSHYTGTLHAYALEIETQQVWDFAGDGFVHRLIHNKADRKLVEVPDPTQTSGERPQVPARLSDVQEERLVHGKLEGLAYQYNTLLTSQLDEQRNFYQKQLNELLEQQEKDRREQRENMVSGSELISALRQEKRDLESKCASAADRLKKVREETAFLWELDKSLEANKEQWSVSLDQAQRDLDAAKKTREHWVPQLEEKVARLMLKLDSVTTCGSSNGGSSESVPGSARGVGSNSRSSNVDDSIAVGDSIAQFTASLRNTPEAERIAAGTISVSEVGEGVGETKGLGIPGKAVGIGVARTGSEGTMGRTGGKAPARERSGPASAPSSQQGHSAKKKTRRKKGK